MRFYSHNISMRTLEEVQGICFVGRKITNLIGNFTYKLSLGLPKLK